MTINSAGMALWSFSRRLQESFPSAADIIRPNPRKNGFTTTTTTRPKSGIILAMGWAVFGLFVGDWVAWLLVYPELTFDAAWSSLGRLRPVHTTAVIFGFGGNALIATSLYVLQRTSRARLPDQLSPWFVLLGYNLFCVISRHRLHDGDHAVEGICRTRMVRRHLAGDRLGRLFHHLSAHAGAAQRATHLRGQLVLHGLHPGRGGAAHRQQSRGPGFVRTRQKLLVLLRRPGCDDAMVVRPQRGRVLPDRGLPRHDVLLPAQTRRSADLLLSAVDHQLLGHHLPLHVGGIAPPALHGAAALGADPRHDIFGHAAGARPGRPPPMRCSRSTAPGTRSATTRRCAS